LLAIVVRRVFFALLALPIAGFSLTWTVIVASAVAAADFDISSFLPQFHLCAVEPLPLSASSCFAGLLRRFYEVQYRDHISSRTGTLPPSATVGRLRTTTYELPEGPRIQVISLYRLTSRPETAPAAVLAKYRFET
jgi:hypothetical protein